MLRECARVLKPGGILAGYLIHTTPGLSDAEEERRKEVNMRRGMDGGLLIRSLLVARKA